MSRASTARARSRRGSRPAAATTVIIRRITSGDSIAVEAKKNISLRAGENITIAAKKNIMVETEQDGVYVRANKEVSLTAVKEDLTLEAGSKKVVVKAANDVEIAAGAVAKISGSDIKWSKA